MLRRTAMAACALWAAGCSSDPTAATCPAGTRADPDGSCLVTCQRDEECLAVQSCQDGVCRARPADLPTILDLWAEPNPVPEGQGVVINFVTVGAEQVELIQTQGGDDRVLWAEPGQASGSHRITRVTEPLLLRLEARTGEQIQAEDLRVELAAERMVRIQRFDAAPTVVQPGGDVTLSWATVDAENVAILTEAGAIFTDLAASGERVVQPAESVVYTLLADGPGGPVEESVEVQVQDDVEPTILDFSVSPGEERLEGDSVVFTWATKGGTNLSLLDLAGQQPLFTTMNPLRVAEGAFLYVPPPAPQRSLRLRLGPEPVTSDVEVVVKARPEPPVIRSAEVAPLLLPPNSPSGVQVLIEWEVSPPDANVVVSSADRVLGTHTGSGQERVNVTNTGETQEFFIYAEVPEGGADVAQVTAWAVENELEPNGIRAAAQSMDGVAIQAELETDAGVFGEDWFRLNAVPAGGTLDVRILSGGCAGGLILEVYEAGSAMPKRSAVSSNGQCPELFDVEVGGGTYYVLVKSDSQTGMAGDVPYQLVVEVRDPACGNGDVDTNEACDDGNRAFGDRCRPDCTVDPAYEYAVTESSAGPPPPPGGESLRFDALPNGSRPPEDEGVAVVPFEAPFSFFGRSYAGALVSTNGFIALVPPEGGDLDGPLGPQAPNAVVALFAGDLVLGEGDVSVRTDNQNGEGLMQLRFTGLEVRGAPMTRLDGAITLTEDGRIVLQYGPDLRAGPNQSLQAGIEDHTGEWPVWACDETACDVNALEGRRFVFTPATTLDD